MGIRPEQVDRLLRAAAIQRADVNENRHDRERPVASPRDAGLCELEDDPLEWLTKVIGHCPHRSKSAAGVILAWRRTALAIEDYRSTRARRSGLYRATTSRSGRTSGRSGRSCGLRASASAATAGSSVG